MMRSLLPSDLLQIWEAGQQQSSVQRALWLLAAACPDLSPDLLAQFSLGQRDACLLTLREQMFGSQLMSVTCCPHCGDRLELTLNTADLRAPTEETAPPAPLTLTVDDRPVQVRLPNSLDLLAITSCAPAEAQAQLLQRCILDIQPAAELSAAAVAAIAAAMAAADPQADVQLAMQCPVCAHEWQVAFDIVSFFWSEINAWAQRRLQEVHTLAIAYGWHEADILRMHPHRRQFYLELVIQHRRN
jgi:hypothetical protein